jgi:hypothetical protein
VLARTLIPSSGGQFHATMGTSVGRNQGSPNSLFFIDVPPGEQEMSVSLKTADFNADNPYTYELFSPSGTEVVGDATPSTTDTTPTGAANLSVAKPAQGRWLIVVQLNLTTSGNKFSQTVNGDVTFNNSGVSVVSGLPTSAKTMLPQGVSQPVTLTVRNTTGVGRTFTFSSNAGDIGPVSTFIAAGDTKSVSPVRVHGQVICVAED